MKNDQRRERKGAVVQLGPGGSYARKFTPRTSTSFRGFCLTFASSLGLVFFLSVALITRYPLICFLCGMGGLGCVIPMLGELKPHPRKP